MGCDIHLHTEFKSNGEWHHMNSVRMERDYDLFSYLCGVRGTEDAKPLIWKKNRGLPENISVVTQMDIDEWGDDGHDHNYLNAPEIMLLEEWLRVNRSEDFPERQWGYLFGVGWGGFTMYPEDRPKIVDDVRFVFWFDN